MAYLGRKGAAAALTSADIPDNSITAAKIVADTIAAGDIGTNAVGADELANDAVDTNAIADDAVTGGKLANDIAISTTGAITGATVDAITDFTVGNTVITDGNIADTGTLAIVPVDGCTIALGSGLNDDFNVDSGKFIVEGDTGEITMPGVLSLSNETLDSGAASYTKMNLTTTKTAGATTNSHHFTMINSNFHFNDTDTYFGNLVNTNITTTVNADFPSISNTSAECTSITGFQNILNFNVGDVENIQQNKVVFDIPDGDEVCRIDDTITVNLTDVDIGTGQAGLGNAVHCSQTTIDDDLTAYSNTVHAWSITSFSNFAFLISHYSTLGGAVQYKVDDDGNTYQDGNHDSGTADYAEYFETDGDVIPIGNTVVLDNGQIRQATEGETPIGIIRPHDGVAILGNSAWSKWQLKHLTDDYGKKLEESFTRTKWKKEISEEEYLKRGKTEAGIKIDIEGRGGIKDKIIEGKYYRKYKFHSDRIPDGITVPDDALTTDGKGLRPKLNPDFDESHTYVPREDRDEWHIVGLLGQIPITKGQPTASTWIKMNDVSATVEMWFVK